MDVSLVGEVVFLGVAVMWTLYWRASRRGSHRMLHTTAVREYERLYRATGSRLEPSAERRLWAYVRTSKVRDFGFALVILTGASMSAAIADRLAPGPNYAFVSLSLSVAVAVAVVGVWWTQYAAIRAGRVLDGRASLAVRTVGQFVPGWLRAAPVAGLIGVGAAGWLYVSVGGPTAANAPSALWVAGIAIVAAGLLVAGDAVLRRVLLATLPAGPPELVRIETFVRAVAMRRVVGAELGAIVYALSFVVSAFAVSPRQNLLSTLSPVLLFVVFGLLSGQLLRAPRLREIGEPNTEPVAG